MSPRALIFNLHPLGCSPTTSPRPDLLLNQDSEISYEDTFAK